MPSITVRDDAHWRELRKAHVGSSDAAVLFGISARKSRWQLFQEKTGKLPELDLDDLTHVRNGKAFEPAIAAIGADKFGVKVRKVRRYLECDDCPALGASLDYEQATDALVPVELKWSVYGVGWEYEGDAITQAPDDYLVQVQSQLACVPSAPYARLWAFIAGDVREMIVEPRPKIISAIKSEAAAFMQDVRELREPPVDFAADAEAISRLAAINPLCRVDLPKECEKLAAEYLTAKALEREHEKRADAARAEILKIMLDAATAKGAAVDEQSIRCDIGGFRISASMVAGGPGTLITPELVGTYYGARKAYRRVMISEPKVKVK